MLESDELCDLLWQHEHHNRWITYSNEDLVVINKAFRKNQKTVTLPNSNPKKKLLINFLKMYQKNIVSEYEQRIRCIVYNNGFYVWLWNEDTYWNCYTPHLSILLEIAYTKKQKSINFCLKDDYEVDLHAFTQINITTSYSRVIKREKVDVIGNNPELVAMILNTSISCEKHICEMSKREDSRTKPIVLDVLNGETVSEVPETLENRQSMQSGMTSNFPIPESLAVVGNGQSAQSSSSSGLQVLEVSPPDPAFEENQNYHIFSTGCESFNATLNLTDVQNNNNKFYILQLLKHKKKKMYGVWYHWGRVGSGGQSKFIKFGTNLSEAKTEFEKKFYDKTRNHWEEKNFVKVPGKYDFVLTDLSPQVHISENSAASKLEPKLQSLMEMICDKKLMEELMAGYFYDSATTPLGKLDAKQLAGGYTALRKICNILENPKKSKSCRELIDACNEFYTKIPHNFGRNVPPLIKSMEDVEAKLSMLEALYNIDVAMSAMNEDTHGPEHPFDRSYKLLQCTLEPLLSTSEEFMIVQKCLKETHGPTHSTYQMEVIDIFKCTRNQEQRSFMNFNNNFLLWHGSRITNWFSILKKGLKIAPPEAPATGYMFGKGIYFADVSSKSANYCYATRKKKEGLLLLSEVSLGSQLLLHHAKEISSLPEGHNSVFGTGQIQPSSFQTTVLSSDAKLPLGPLIETENQNETYSLYYNEYVIYDVRQVKMKYIVRLKFNFL